MNPKANLQVFFFLNSKQNLSDINSLAERYKKANFISSGNFLAFTMHEWMHSIHLNNIYKLNCYNIEKVIKELKKISSIEFSDDEIELIADFIGEYTFINGRINPFEVLAEGANKIVLGTLDGKEIRIKKA